MAQGPNGVGSPFSAATRVARDVVGLYGKISVSSANIAPMFNGLRADVNDLEVKGVTKKVHC